MNHEDRVSFILRGYKVASAISAGTSAAKKGFGDLLAQLAKGPERGKVMKQMWDDHTLATLATGGGVGFVGSKALGGSKNRQVNVVKV